ncbi:hypothetical protein EV356DRAFT_134535 [Viridothelium virens]|uniref:Uncharacterized protein n=1 Tax=Viridothelium virens TaxID=1048519 RepID=A0A6A6HC14_VIRVR|nr:hypothetical protein EV356DRAFT_134535 [Viridothelium virens]
MRLETLQLKFRRLKGEIEKSKINYEYLHGRHVAYEQAANSSDAISSGNTQWDWVIKMRAELVGRMRQYQQESRNVLLEMAKLKHVQPTNQNLRVLIAESTSAREDLLRKSQAQQTMQFASSSTSQHPQGEAQAHHDTSYSTSSTQEKSTPPLRRQRLVHRFEIWRYEKETLEQQPEQLSQRTPGLSKPQRDQPSPQSRREQSHLVSQLSLRQNLERSKSKPTPRQPRSHSRSRVPALSSQSKVQSGHDTRHGTDFSLRRRSDRLSGKQVNYNLDTSEDEEMEQADNDDEEIEQSVDEDEESELSEAMSISELSTPNSMTEG